MIHQPGGHLRTPLYLANACCLRISRRSITNSPRSAVRPGSGQATPLGGVADEQLQARYADPRAAPYCAVMTTPGLEERIMELMPEDAKAALLLLARQLPYEVGEVLDRIEGRKS